MFIFFALRCVEKLIKHETYQSRFFYFNSMKSRTLHQKIFIAFCEQVRIIIVIHRFFTNNCGICYEEHSSAGNIFVFIISEIR